MKPMSASSESTAVWLAMLVFDAGVADVVPNRSAGVTVSVELLSLTMTLTRMSQIWPGCSSFAANVLR
jgi:hypothetical protein